MNNTRRLFELYGRIEQLIVPGLRDSQYLYRETLEKRIQPGVRWLELGCGHHILARWMSSSEQREHELVSATKLTVGIDISYSSLRNHRSIPVRTVGTVEALPFRDGSFDVVSANMVMEHVIGPEAALAEIHRVLSPGGIFIFHTPNVWNYQFAIARWLPQGLKNKLVWLLERRREEDVFPTAYRINSPAAVSQAAARTGFQIADLALINSTAATALIAPLAVIELLFIRLLECGFARRLRSNIIAVLKRP